MTRRSLAIGILALVQALVLAAASLAAVERWGTLSLDGGDYVLLVMGSDQGPYRPGNVYEGRVDAIQLVVVDRQQTHVSVVSIPRDSYVPVRGRGTDKINTMLLGGGPSAAVGTIEDLTGLEVDDWMITSFRGLIDGIDTFGGVNVNVERNLTNTGHEDVNLQAGQQTLTGEQALGYARDRKSRPDGDLGRTAAQGDLLRFLHRDLVKRTDSPIRLAAYAARMQAHTESSISMRGMLRLGHTAASIKPKNVSQVSLPASVGSAGSQSVVFLGGGAQAVFADLRDDGRRNNSN